MAVMKLTSWPAERDSSGVVSYHITGKSPIPEKTVDIVTALDAREAFANYAADAKATGLPLHVFAVLRRGDRAPRGYRQLKLDRNINV